MKIVGRVLIVLIIGVLETVWGDTPANCTYDDMLGHWTLQETQRDSPRQLVCSQDFAPKSTLKVELLFPDVVIDEFGNKGYWTLIYNQGFEIVLKYRKYFAFSAYKTSGKNVTSYCDATLPGWSHDIIGNNWACYKATKDTPIPPKFYQQDMLDALHGTYKHNPQFISNINEHQNSWVAGPYAEMEGMTHEELLSRRGGRGSHVMSPPSPAISSKRVQNLADRLPKSFDWRKQNGVNYVSPIRNQGTCGSCYAFSSTAMIEARLRVLTNNSLQLQLSPQDIVDCSEYSQGCAGGFPYLVAGKYAQDFGMVEETCNPYKGTDETCKKNVSCQRHYVAEYRYVGGFYGGCNEDLMRIQLVRNGPMSVSFEVYPDFQAYTGGIYHHTGLEDKFNPFSITNHVVLVVGYGEENNEKFWIVKNSWGESWGEKGFFRIRRGVNECGIESIAAEAFPIP